MIKRHFYNFYNLLTGNVGNARIVDAVIIINVAVIEPWTITRFPRGRAYHAELGGTAASHVVAAFLKLNHSLAAVASLPALVFCHLDQTIRLLILGALLPSVELAVAQDAYLGLATTATRILHAVCQVHPNLARLDPFSTSLSRTVESVSGRVLLIFLVPQLLELVVEEALDVSERDVFGRTASRRHMLGVIDGEGELASEARMAHTMAAPELGSFVDG